MRVPGDPDGCRAVARELLRAAQAAHETADSVAAAAVVAAARWSGAAALAAADLSGRRALALRGTAEQLAAAAAVLGDHAGLLQALQDRARAVRRAASVPEACLTPYDRSRLARAAAEIADELAALHRATQARLAAVHGARGVDVAWSPSAWDLPSGALTALQGAAAAGRLSAPLLLATGPGAALGALVSGGSDLAQGRSARYAVGKAVITTSVGTAAALAATAQWSALLAAGAVLPAAVPPVLVAVAAGAVVGWSAGRLWDAVADRAEPARHPVRLPSTAPRRVHTAPSPRPAPAPSPAR